MEHTIDLPTLLDELAELAPDSNARHQADNLARTAHDNDRHAAALRWAARACTAAMSTATDIDTVCDIFNQIGDELDAMQLGQAS